MDDILTTEDIDDFEKTIADDEWLKSKGVDIEGMNKSIKSRLHDIGFNITFDLFPTFPYQEFKSIVCREFNEFQWKKEGSQFFFNQLERLFKEAYFTNCIILLDEAEKLIQHQNFNERRTFCENVRSYFIDGNSSNALDGFFKMLITLHPNSQELLMPHWSSAGLDRICQLGGGISEENTVYFKPLQDENMQVNLALAYLDHSRSDEGMRGKSDPFSREALLYAMTREEGIVGKYLKLLYLCIEKATKYKWNTIGTEQIDLVKDGSKEEAIDTSITDVQPTEALPESKVQL